MRELGGGLKGMGEVINKPASQSSAEDILHLTGLFKLVCLN
jgi:hypothetical protein